MMKKRLLAFGLAGVMLMGMSMNVFAAVSDDTNNWEYGADPAEKNITVSGNKAPTYTVKIPKSMDEKDVFTIAAEGNLEQGKRVVVKLSEIEMTMTRNMDVDPSVEKKNAYKVNFKLDTTPITADTSLLTLSESETGTITSKNISLDLTNKGSDLKAGNYTGTVSFNVTYENS